ncbi:MULTISPECIES: DUF4236 domain-containing protein [unclassified Rhizobium]|uniref:DUF4236 domain-containing protein n=1 Tax=unclassified Rhizobium TaxID=2613769 RepID=UPI001ADD5D05|nr:MULTISPECIES: DUF4236 domain-containing protein [unclassified Rhizobium]MBO9102188.1 DUF4236 domain-containing protein [Rhizobium sp. L58/93]MBO9172284.1 DUF4236 domain-containing protein [Rhizobium sp. L245/93]MBO9188033.1 DUF4236 domain-containing protein [Rhizobium sp. E27B/91]QXZ86307.1 DUF4236 domain-containing protein [Rhizobium sp. K1/93]QXZ92238.1 DUF4236 domain-containing protein [Rhizobium sp. K15/93]
MPFYFRKSISAGPFRFNFSKGGLGVSVGIRGLRIGTGPRGHYVHAGRNGFYYRASIGKAGKKAARTGHDLIPDVTRFEESGVDMIEVDSGDVMLMRDEKFSDLLDEINAKNQQVRLATAFGWSAAVLGLVIALMSGTPGILVILAALPAYAVGTWLDSYRRTTVLYYDISDGFEQAYKKLIDGFDGLNGCSAKWHIAAGGAIQDLKTWKRNAGASHLVSKKTTTLAYALPRVIKSNVTPPSLHVGRRIIYFLPDVALIVDGGKIGAVGYDDLQIQYQDSHFIESGTVPRDAKVVDHTWQHPNKGGGPDRRFASNRQIPICLYETMHLQSNSGLNELLEFSKTGQAASFVAACKALAKAREEAVLAPAQVALADLRTTDVSASEPIETNKSGNWIAYVVALLVIGVPGIVLLANHSQTTTPASGYKPAFASTATATTSTAGSGPGVPRSPAPLVSSAGVAAQSPVAISADGGTVAPTAEPIQSAIQTAAPASPPDGDAFETLVSIISVPEPQAETPISSPPPPAPKFGYIRLPLQLREGPSPAYLVVTSVAQNLQVAIIGQENGWTRVSAGPDAIGWVPKEMVGKAPIVLQKPEVQQPVKSAATASRRENGR